jgi:hypothetical protein
MLLGLVTQGRKPFAGGEPGRRLEGVRLGVDDLTVVRDGEVQGVSGTVHAERLHTDVFPL